MFRTLPIRVAPLIGESLESWLAAYAIRMQCTWAELLAAVLPTNSDGAVVVPRRRTLTGGLSAPEREAISTATGTSHEDIAAMTLTGRYQQRLVRVDASTFDTRTPWGRIYRQRFCPHCLVEDPGRYKLSWQLPWVTVCVEHQCVLADVCPRCGQDQIVAPYWLRHDLKPQPACCQRFNHSDARQQRCLAQLSKTDTTGAEGLTRSLTSTQQTIQRLLDQDAVGEGVYEQAPIGIDQFLVDIRTLGGWILRNATAQHVADLLFMNERESYRQLDSLRCCNTDLPNGSRCLIGMSAPAAIS
jgi:hypothetical protein